MGRLFAVKNPGSVDASLMKSLPAFHGPPVRRLPALLGPPWQDLATSGTPTRSLPPASVVATRSPKSGVPADGDAVAAVDSRPEHIARPPSFREGPQNHPHRDRGATPPCVISTRFSFACHPRPPFGRGIFTVTQLSYTFRPRRRRGGGRGWALSREGGLPAWRSYLGHPRFWVRIISRSLAAPPLAHRCRRVGAVHSIIHDRFSRFCLPVHVRFAPKAYLRPSGTSADRIDRP
jgi:hypothetical protein